VDNPRSHWICVEVPAIIDDDLWAEAAKRKQSNRDRAARNTKHPYLMAKRMICGACGGKIYAHTLREGTHRTKSYGYYVCSNNDSRGRPLTCNSPQFSSAAVDDAVWTWLKTLLVDPCALKKGLLKHQTEIDKANRPLRQRLEVLEDLIATNRSQMERLLDLYLIGDIPADLLTERRKRLEHTVSSLEREASKLQAQLESEMLTTEQIENLLQFAAQVSDGLNQADADFATRAQIVNRLTVEASLAVEQDEKVVHARCILGTEKLPIASTTSTDTAPYTPAPPRRWPAPVRATPPAGC
jgi:site-specific DNA recombinase